ncbi:hypothetical protein ACFYSC_01930 [Streptosporangium sp. NPDC004379]|uniref:hypothetical protein n=1 Tax=Streptosporangium sp. NPDC004379 TaxID=3366189 RepID=UPI0036892704
MRVIVIMDRDGVRITVPGQCGVLFGFDAWADFLRRAKKGFFDPFPADGEKPGNRSGS